MKPIVSLSAAGVFLGGALVWLAGCQNPSARTLHTVLPRPPDFEMTCQLCYDEAVSLTRPSPDGAQSKAAQTVRQHMCPGCNAEVTAYTLDRKPMIRCPGCVPEGVLCDRCLPPKTARPAEVAAESWYEVGGD